MNSSVTCRVLMAAMVIVGILILVGCGRGMSGTYVPSGVAAFSKLEFKSGGKVEMTIAVAGSTLESSYEIDGKEVKITTAGTTTVFRMDDQGCLDGGGVGKYCKQ